MRLAGRVSVILLLIAALGLHACTPGTSPNETVVVTAGGGPPPVSLPNFTGPEDLERAMFAFGACVERSFPISMRFRTDPYVGYSTAVGSLREEDGDRVDEVTAVCMARTDLDRRLGVFQINHPLTPEQDREIAAAFVVCVEAVSPELADRVSRLDIDDQEDVGKVMMNLRSGEYGGNGDDLVAVSECQEEMTGPEHVFADGHPWFRP